MFSQLVNYHQKSPPVYFINLKSKYLFFQRSFIFVLNFLVFVVLAVLAVAIVVVVVVVVAVAVVVVVIVVVAIIIVVVAVEVLLLGDFSDNSIKAKLNYNFRLQPFSKLRPVGDKVKLFHF